MDTSTSGTKVSVFLHKINQQGHGDGGEVDVSVKCEQEGVLGDDFLTVDRDGLVHELEAQKIVHVHHLEARGGSICHYSAATTTLLQLEERILKEVEVENNQVTVDKAKRVSIQRPGTLSDLRSLKPSLILAW